MLSKSPESKQLSLDEEFLEAYATFHQSRQTALTAFIQLDLKIQKLALFSRNETKQDINDKHLKFMLIPAFIGLGLVDWSGGRDREMVLKKAFYYLKQFLDMMENYEFLSSQDQVRLRRSDNRNGLNKSNQNKKQR
jgi:TAP42-like family